jgi:hypothetical protein
VSDDPAFQALVQTLAELPPIERRALCRMPPGFWQDMARELTSAAMFGDPGSLRIDVHHASDGEVRGADFQPERHRKYQVAKRTEK